MRWPRRRRPEPETGHGRDPSGRLYDGDGVRPPGWDGWADLIPGYRASGALTGPTDILPTMNAPLMTPAQRWRSQGGGWA